MDFICDCPIIRLPYPPALLLCRYRNDERKQYDLALMLPIADIACPVTARGRQGIGKCGKGTPSLTRDRPPYGGKYGHTLSEVPPRITASIFGRSRVSLQFLGPYPQRLLIRVTPLNSRSPLNIGLSKAGIVR